jgi:hypothetical protein
MPHIIEFGESTKRHLITLGCDFSAQICGHFFASLDEIGSLVAHAIFLRGDVM